MVGYVPILDMSAQANFAKKVYGLLLCNNIDYHRSIHHTFYRYLYIRFRAGNCLSLYRYFKNPAAVKQSFKTKLFLVENHKCSIYVDFFILFRLFHN